MDWKSQIRQSLLAILLFVTPAVNASEGGPETGTLLVMGDSISAAYGMSSEQGWVSLLSQRIDKKGLPWSVTNASVSGETTGGGLARLPRLLDTHRPQLIILQLGGNDGLRGLPVPSIRDNLQAMIELSLDSGADVLLAGIRIPPNYGPRYTEPFFAQYRDLADEYDLTLLPFLLDGIADNRELMQSDGIHPTAEAQPMILDNVWPVLMDML
ncbi:MAG: arylesterase [Pseudohongiellaceae bacterium]